MNAAQIRLLLETEFQFYQLQVSRSEFEMILTRIGFKPRPDISKLDNSALKRLNLKLRTSLRSPSAITS